MSYDAALHDIEIIMDDAAKLAATVFHLSARLHLKPFNLSRHRIQFQLEEVVVHAIRADEKVETRYAYEFYEVGAARSALRALNRAYYDLPENVRRHLAGVTL